VTVRGKYKGGVRDGDQGGKVRGDSSLCIRIQGKGGVEKLSLGWYKKGCIISS